MNVLRPVARSVERLEAEMSQQIGELRDTVIDDLSGRLETLQEDTSAILLSSREHMDNEFEVHAPISKSTNLYLASTNTDPLTF